MASLETFVWVDSDEDGVQGADEPGLAGATLNLYNETGAIAETEHKTILASRIWKTLGGQLLP
jgi:hypothetical protein